jgi:hypothetical protein
VCTPHGLCRVSQSVWTSCEFGMSAWTLHKNCTQQGLNQAFNNRTNSSYEMPTLPLYHCGLPYLANLCYICNLWLNWETYLLLFNMGHMIYVLDKFFNVNSMAAACHFMIRLTIFGNFSKYAVYISPGPVFQCEFNCDVYFGIKLTILGNFFVLYVCIYIVHHFSV